MAYSLLVTLREGVEIALVVSILLGYLRSLGQTRRARPIWLGVGAAALLSIGIGAALEVTSHELDGRVLEVFEGLTMLFAVVVLTWMVLWMKRQSAGISRELRHQVDHALSHGSVLALAALSFSAVAREGLETALFLFAGSTNATSSTQFWIGGMLGFVVAGVIGVVLYFGSARIPLKQFFMVTGLVVIVLAGGLMSNGLGELHAAGYFDVLSHRPWDTETTISMTSTLGKFLHTVLGYDSAPTLAQIIAFWGYLAFALTLFVAMPVQPPTLRASAPPATMANPERGSA